MQIAKIDGCAERVVKRTPILADQPAKSGDERVLVGDRLKIGVRCKAALGCEHFKERREFARDGALWLDLDFFDRLGGFRGRLAQRLRGFEEINLLAFLNTLMRFLNIFLALAFLVRGSDKPPIAVCIFSYDEQIFDEANIYHLSGSPFLTGISMLRRSYPGHSLIVSPRINLHAHFLLVGGKAVPSVLRCQGRRIFRLLRSSCGGRLGRLLLAIGPFPCLGSFLVDLGKMLTDRDSLVFFRIERRDLFWVGRFHNEFAGLLIAKNPAALCPRLIAGN